MACAAIEAVIAAIKETSGCSSACERVGAYISAGPVSWAGERATRARACSWGCARRRPAKGKSRAELLECCILTGNPANDPAPSCACLPPADPSKSKHVDPAARRAWADLPA